MYRYSISNLVGIFSHVQNILNYYFILSNWVRSIAWKGVKYINFQVFNLLFHVNHWFAFNILVQFLVCLRFYSENSPDRSWYLIPNAKLWSSYRAAACMDIIGQLWKESSVIKPYCNRDVGSLELWFQLQKHFHDHTLLQDQCVIGNECRDNCLLLKIFI